MDQWPGWLGRRGQLGEWWWRRLGQPPELWRRRVMDQSLVSAGPSRGCVLPRSGQPILFVPSELVVEQSGHPFVVIVKSREELCQWVSNPPAGLQWLEVNGLPGDADVWEPAAQSGMNVPMDVFLANPGSQFSDLYRLADVCAVRDVRVSMPARPGFLRAVKLAIALQLPVRLLPGQPNPEVLTELAEAVTFYLREPMVETPVEFFHSVLAFMCGADTGSLWTILEEDPASFLRKDRDGRFKLPRGSGSPPLEISLSEFVANRFEQLLEQNTECTTCPWQQICQGYFKWPDSAYDCRGIKQLFTIIKTAADEMKQELVHRDQANTEKQHWDFGSEASS
jgi:hypothetical protein